MRERLSKLKWWQWILIVIFGLWVLGIVVPSSDNGNDSESKQDSQKSETTVVAETKKVSCIPLSESVLNAIASGEEDGVGMSPTVGYAIKSTDFNNVYFMAIEFGASGIENQVGVWARNGIESGIIMSVDGTAKSFTVWPDASSTDAQISGADRNIDLVKSCL
jgi:hypothetical protein